MFALAGCTRIPSSFEPDIDRRPLEYPNRYGLAPFVRMNDPEFLQACPFAYNAVNAGLALGLSED